jgi:cytochrome c-type biogenesis protein CcmH/NrfG
VADTDDAGFYDELGDALYEQERYAEAEAAYREAIRLDPGGACYYAWLAGCLIAQERYAEGEVSAREAIRLDPGDDFHHAQLGFSLQAQERYAEAEAAFREAARLDPDCAALHTFIGAELALQGKHAAAEAELRESLRLDPGSDETWGGLGEALCQQGKFTEALSAYWEAIQLAPEETGYLIEANEVYVQLKQHGLPQPARCARPAAEAAEQALRNAVLARTAVGSAVRCCFYQNPVFTIGLFVEMTRRRFGTGYDAGSVARFVAGVHEHSTQSFPEGFPRREAEALVRAVLGEVAFLASRPQLDEGEVCITLLDAMLAGWQPGEAELDSMFDAVRALTAEGRGAFAGLRSAEDWWFAHGVPGLPFASWTPPGDDATPYPAI